MLTVTLEQIRKGYSCNQKYRVYIIEGEGCVLYVGQSKDAISRVESHLGLGNWAGFWGSDLDMMLNNNLAASKEFTASFLVEEYIESEDYPLEQISIDDLEENLIYLLAPVFNAKGKKAHKLNTDKWYSLHPPGIANAGIVLD